MSANFMLYVADLIAIAVLALAVYFPRHHRRDLVVAYLGMNLGIMAVSSALLSTTSGAGLGLGLGLFGVLSIIRLRSEELTQLEVAYYFSSLALGLLSSLGSDPVPSIGLMVFIVAVMFAADHPAVLRGYRRERVVLDRAITDETVLVRELEARLGRRVVGVNVTRLDLVNDTTSVDVTSFDPLARRGARDSHETVDVTSFDPLARRGAGDSHETVDAAR